MVSDVFGTTFGESKHVFLTLFILFATLKLLAPLRLPASSIASKLDLVLQLQGAPRFIRMMPSRAAFFCHFGKYNSDFLQTVQWSSRHGAELEQSMNNSEFCLPTIGLAQNHRLKPLYGHPQGPPNLTRTKQDSIWYAFVEL
jgi:hypothetical protein